MLEDRVKGGMISFCEQDMDLVVGGLVKRGDTGRNNSLVHVKIVTTARPSREEEKDDMLAAIVLPLGSGRVANLQGKMVRHAKMPILRPTR